MLFPKQVISLFWQICSLLIETFSPMWKVSWTTWPERYGTKKTWNLSPRHESNIWRPEHRGRSIHWVTRTKQGYLTQFICFLCPTLVWCWSIHVSHIVTEIFVHISFSLIWEHRYTKNSTIPLFILYCILIHPYAWKNSLDQCEREIVKIGMEPSYVFIERLGKPKS